jgi:uncharacterized membrane protein YkvA (DUF1232 family)
VDLVTIVGGIILGLVVLWLALLLALWLLRPRDVSAMEVVRVIPDVLRLAKGLLADPATPTGVRVALGVLFVWLISPIDLVPEFIPVLGPLDDVIVTVVVLRYVRRRLGSELLFRRWPGSGDGFRVLTALAGHD